MCSENGGFSLEFFNIFDESTENLNWLNLDDVLGPSWREKPIHEWSPVDVLEFIENETSHFSLFINLERFACISGYIFQTLSKEYCQILTRSTEIGEFIFDAKEKFIKNNQYVIQPNNSVTVHIKEEENIQPKNICDTSQKVHKKKPGRPRSILTKRRKREETKSKKLWEFLLHLLRDKKTCPEIIKWENFEEGTFKFVRTDTVARLWGSRNQNKNMTYEKFTRAIRYYYKSKILLPVHGRRLVYKFGPYAKGWNCTMPS